MKAVNSLFGVVLFTFIISSAFAYPPAVGILGPAKNCLVCHSNNGPWKDDALTIIDILDKETKQSLRQSDGSFLLKFNKGEAKTFLTVIGRAKFDTLPDPSRNAWLYIDPATIGTSSLSKFPPGWEVNLPMACRMSGDKLEGYEGDKITVLPMTVRPTEVAQNAEIILQVMLTRGEAVKGKAKEGMVVSYLERKVRLLVK